MLIIIGTRESQKGH